MTRPQRGQLPPLLLEVSSQIGSLNLVTNLVVGRPFGLQQTLRMHLGHRAVTPNTYENIVQACKRAWDFLITDPDRIRWIGTRGWACVNL
jgi:hypothetical protein